MLVTFMVDGVIEQQTDMDAVPRTGEKVWLRRQRNGSSEYTPTTVTAVDWHGSERVELRLSTSKQRGAVCDKK